ncbi:hypothetical protein BGZ94_007174 [Podila epigama]|nr:hypothetical protein BGZ94_007174 [Podila epigama]
MDQTRKGEEDSQHFNSTYAEFAKETSFVRAGDQLQVSWSYSEPYPATISIELVDTSKRLFNGPLSILSNLPTTQGVATWNVPKVGFVGGNFSVHLISNNGGTALILAEGQVFEVKPEGAPYPSSSSNGQSVLASKRSTLAERIILIAVIAIVLSTF